MEENYRIDKNLIKKIKLPIILISFCYLLGIILYNKLPFFVPTSWDLEGRINAYLPKNIALTFLPTISLILLLIFIFLPLLDPFRKNYTKFFDTYFTIVNMIIFISCFMHIIMIFVIFTQLNKLIPKVSYIFTSIIYLTIGNFFPRIKRNWFIGVGSPWTMINENIWNKTQRFAGFLIFFFGFIFFFFIFFKIPDIFLSVDWAFIILILSYLYSIFIFLKFRKNSNEFSFKNKKEIFISLIFVLIHLPFWYLFL